MQYDRGDILEWMLLLPGGIDHGFTVPSKPLPGMGDVSLWIELDLSGNLLARMHEGGSGVTFSRPDGTPVLLYTGLSAQDASGKELPARMRIDRRLLVIEVDDSDATYPVVIDPLVSSPTWGMRGEQDGMKLGFSVATAGDVNGDGFSDLLVGSPSYDGSFVDSGRAELYPGGPDGLSSTPVWISNPVEAGSEYGFSVASAGDVDGDGYDDILVGAPGGLNGAGRAFLYRGGPEGPSSTADHEWTGTEAGARLGAAVSWAGDVDRDGFADVLIAEPGYDGGAADIGRVSVHRGRPAGIEPGPHRTIIGVQPGEQLGTAVSTALDVNGDGFDDVVLGAPGATSTYSGEGRVVLFLGGSAGLGADPVWEVFGGQAGAEMGASVAGGGDIDGDGYADLLVGGPGITDGQAEEGAAFIFPGSASGPPTAATRILYGDKIGARFGSSVATAGDVGGDGYADVIVGTPSYVAVAGEDAGAIWVYEGTPDGLALSPALNQKGAQSGGKFGNSVGTAGDVNGDGLSDVAVGSPGYGDINAHEGSVQVYFGSPYGIDNTADWSVIGASSGGSLGKVAHAGDANGDGFDDVLIGKRGEVRLYPGSTEGLAPSPLWTVAGLALYNEHAGAGDVNGDGFSDIVIGDPGHDTAREDVGRVQLYLGSPTGPGGTPDWMVVGTLTKGEFGSSVAGAGDVNGDGFADVIVGEEHLGNLGNGLGRAYVFLGSAGGLNSSPAWMVESEQPGSVYGRTVSSAGDVNADGFADVLVAAPWYENGNFREGKVYLYLGSPAGLSQTSAWTAESNIGVEPFGTSFGEALAAAGDVNGDGYGDVIIGAPRYDEGQFDQGAAFLYFGTPDGLAENPAWILVGVWSSDQLGSSVASAGDINRDGYDDIAVGTPFIDYYNPYLVERAGQVTLHLGSESGPSPESAWVFYGEHWSFLGAENEIAGSMDVNADGYPDLMVGASRYDINLFTTDVGAAWLFHGGGDAGRTRLVFQGRLGDGSAVLPWGRSDSVDSFQLRADGFSASGRQPVLLEWELRLPGEVYSGLGIQRGGLVADSGPPGTTGSVVALAENTGPLASDSSFHWRLRVATETPLFPHGPWRRLTGVGQYESVIRTLKPGNPQDMDGDGFDETLDCDESNPGLWGVPGETVNLQFDDTKVWITYDPPPFPGSLPSAVTYDTLRSGEAGNFESAAICINQNVTSPVAADPTDPPAGIVVFYLSRARNGCGPGSLGNSSDGVPRTGRSCP
ncbi:MAG: FG-GAP repeat protein [Acidobacteria bacterium]|uniref:FG-GAP repeat protein n=1 Tax=Candidatus Polarisedimenticola svalbardensis TaxID=2886004 RepID=A0A8J6Y3I8_9BACT|nr:FG-GAP repeat protein [Candidatus Polarisedimenticola svalbardensis]